MGHLAQLHSKSAVQILLRLFSESSCTVKVQLIFSFDKLYTSKQGVQWEVAKYLYIFTLLGNTNEVELACCLLPHYMLVALRKHKHMNKQLQVCCVAIYKVYAFRVYYLANSHLNLALCIKNLM